METMTWKLILNPNPLVLKLCNTCGKVIDTFNETHPVTKYMVNNLKLDETSDLNQLDLGLQPFHWCPIKEDNHCLIPLRHSLKTKEEEEALTKLPEPSKQHAPYHDRKTQDKKQPNRGRPPLTKLLSGTKAVVEKQENESTNSV